MLTLTWHWAQKKDGKMKWQVRPRSGDCSRFDIGLFATSFHFALGEFNQVSKAAANRQSGQEGRHGPERHNSQEKQNCLTRILK